jgi:hypothetical protein
VLRRFVASPSFLKLPIRSAAATSFRVQLPPFVALPEHVRELNISIDSPRNLRPETCPQDYFRVGTSPRLPSLPPFLGMFCLLFEICRLRFDGSRLPAGDRSAQRTALLLNRR